MAIITRTNKGSALTWVELDGNFTELENEIQSNANSIVTINTKLNGIEANADVTDYTSVLASGALMANVNLAESGGTIPETDRVNTFDNQQRIERIGGSLSGLVVKSTDDAATNLLEAEDSNGNRVWRIISNDMNGTGSGIAQFQSSDAWVFSDGYVQVGSPSGTPSSGGLNVEKFYIDGEEILSKYIFADRDTANSVIIPSHIQKIGYISTTGYLVEFVRDASGNALTTGDGATWSPATEITPLHFGDNLDANDLQNTFDYARDSNRRRIFFPSAEYDLGNTSVYFTDDSTANGDPQAITLIGEAQSDILSVSDRGTVIKYTGNNYAFHWGKGTGNSKGPVIINNITFDGANTGSSAFYIKRAANFGDLGPGSPSALQNIRVMYFTGTGAYIYKCYGMEIQASSFIHNGGWGLEADNCNGFYTGGGAKYSFNVSGGLRLFYNSGTAGDGESDAGSASAVASITDSLIEINGGPGISFERHQSAYVAGNYIEGNAANTSPMLAQIDLTGENGTASGATCKAVVITGNRFQANPAPYSDLGVRYDYSEDCWTYGNQALNQLTAFVRYGSSLTKPNYTYGNMSNSPEIDLQSDKKYVLSAPDGGTHSLDADVSESDASLTGIDDLSFYVKTDKKYLAEWTLYFESANTSQGLALAVDGPTSNTVKTTAMIPTSETNIFTGIRNDYNLSVIATTSDSQEHAAKLTCYIEPSTNGTLIPKFRVSANTGEITIKKGSVGFIKEFNT